MMSLKPIVFLFVGGSSLHNYIIICSFIRSVSTRTFSEPSYPINDDKGLKTVAVIESKNLLK